MKDLFGNIVEYLAKTKNCAYYYNRLQWWYRGRYYKNRKISPCYEVMYQELAHLCLKKCAEKIFEFGCGDAYLLRQIHTLNTRKQLFGCDFSETQIKGAKCLLPGAKFQCEDVRAMTYQDKTFDVAIGLSVLMYLTPHDLSLALRELKRISNTVISVEMDCRYLDEKKKGEFRRANDGRFDHDYRRCFLDAGFDIIESRGVEIFDDKTINTLGEMGYGLIVAEPTP